jgi:Domain of unknown function (DUF4412)
MKLNSSSGVRLLCFAVIVAGLGQILCAQDFTVRMKDQDGKTATHYVSRNAVRNVSSNPVETDVIYRLDRGTIIRLNHQQKTYSEITVAQAREQGERSAAGNTQQAMMRRLGMTGGGATSVTKIGPGETIAGYATEKYATKTPISQGEVWVAPALEAPAAYYDMSSSYAAAQMGAMGQIVKELSEKQVKGFMLKVTGTGSMAMMNGIAFTQVATSVERAPIPPATFEPPAGYRKVAAQ